MLCVVGRRNGVTGHHEIGVGESDKALHTGSKCGACRCGHCHVAAVAMIASSRHSLIDCDHCRVRHVAGQSRSKANSSSNDEEQQGGQEAANAFHQQARGRIICAAGSEAGYFVSLRQTSTDASLTLFRWHITDAGTGISEAEPRHGLKVPGASAPAVPPRRKRRQRMV